MADDHDIARLGLVAILNSIPGVTVVGEAHDVPSAVAAVEEYQPDLVLLDVRMPPTNGLDAARRIGRIRPATRIIIISTWGLPEYVLESYRAGALGFLSLGAPRHEIADAVTRVLRDQPLDPRPTPAPPEAQANRTSAADASAAIEALTARRREILELIATGQANRAIAAQLGITEKTVKKTAEQIYRQLGVPNRTQAAMLWMLAGRRRSAARPPSGAAVGDEAVDPVGEADPIGEADRARAHRRGR